MLERFRAFFTKILSPVANLLLRLGVSPDAVTFVGTLGVCAGALVFFPQGMLATGVLVITAFVFSDLLDGYMARTSGRVSKFGAFWDSTLDRIGDGAIFIGLALYFAWEEPSKLYLVLSLVCLLMGGVTSYARSRGETLGFSVKVGIAERADRLVAILVLTVLQRGARPAGAALHRALGARDRVDDHRRPAGVGGPEAGPGRGPTTI